MALAITINDSWELGSRSGKKKLIVKDVTVVGDGVALSVSAADVGLTTIVGCTACRDAPVNSLAGACTDLNNVAFSDGTQQVPLSVGFPNRLLIFGLE